MLHSSKGLPAKTIPSHLKRIHPPVLAVLLEKPHVIEVLSSCWIAKYVPYDYPARSANLTPLDYWEDLKTLFIKEFLSQKTIDRYIICLRVEIELQEGLISVRIKEDTLMKLLLRVTEFQASSLSIKVSSYCKILGTVSFLCLVKLINYVPKPLAGRLEYWTSG